MINQLVIGSLTIILTVAIHAELLNLMWRHYDRMLRFGRVWFGRFGKTSVLMIAMLYVLFVTTVEVWLWAGVLMASGAVEGLEPAVYFALVCFTTLGFGDIILDPQWRLLSGLIGANGFLMFGWSTAFTVELVRRTE